MSLYVLDSKLWFPPADVANDDGLLAIGGDLSTDRLLLAYRNGIFPWFDGEIPLWWCPDPRFVLFPGELKISRSMRTLLNRNRLQFTVNEAFDQVIEACKETKRNNQPGTWITNEVKLAYIDFHRAGHAHSAEAWLDNELVGGLYGVRMGKVFFGESMFSQQANASKYAFIKYVQALQSEGVALIDCQVYTSHLESLGGRMIPREDFLSRLKQYL